MEEEIIKKLPLTAAKKRMSSQTGFVHLWLEDPFDSKQDTIPVLENFLHAYALFRSKTVESIQEGKALLEKLLSFEVEGNFPIYIHEYPKCKDSRFSAQLLPPIFYLIRDFSLVLGDALYQRLLGLSARIVSHLKTQGGGERSLNPPKSPEQWAQLFIEHQIEDKELLVDKPLWNSTLGVFIGECKERFQEGHEPAVSLFDFFMPQIPKRSLIDHPIHLHTSLVRPWKIKPSLSREAPFEVLIDEKKRQVLTFYWGNLDLTHSLVLESKKGSWSIIESLESEWICSYTYDGEIPSEEDSMEWAFYLNDSDQHTILIEGEKATLFHPKQEVTILSKGLRISFQVIADSSGRWTGHLLKGDRSFQKSKKLAYGGYDWKLGWRTLKRDPTSKITVKVKLQPN